MTSITNLSVPAGRRRWRRRRHRGPPEGGPCHTAGDPHLAPARFRPGRGRHAVRGAREGRRRAAKGGEPQQRGGLGIPKQGAGELERELINFSRGKTLHTLKYCIIHCGQISVASFRERAFFFSGRRDPLGVLCRSDPD